MKRNVSLEEISDGKLYRKKDMVRAGCGDCRGCSACCHGMGESIILDPYDVWRLESGTGSSFQELLAEYLELNVVDGLVLPNLKMNQLSDACGFLNEEGRCRIHRHRPGICRLFPLGRYYLPGDEQENEGIKADQRSVEFGEKRKRPGDFRYFLQIHECPMKNKTKVKVEKWIDTPQTDRYEAFISEWHAFLEKTEEKLVQMDDDEIRNVNLFILKLFFIRDYSNDDFYVQYEKRMETARDILEI